MNAHTVGPELPSYVFRVLDERDDPRRELRFLVRKPSEVLLMAALIVSEIRLGHHGQDCSNWSVEVTAPNGCPFTSLMFNYISIYGRCGRAGLEEGQDWESCRTTAEIIVLDQLRSNRRGT